MKPTKYSIQCGNMSGKDSLKERLKLGCDFIAMKKKSQDTFVLSHGKT